MIRARYVPNMHLGAHIGQQNMTMGELRALWRRLDEARVDWISIWDHLYEAPPAGGTVPAFEAVACLAALAADTSHARLGCLVFYVGYRNPGLLAKAAVTIDHISGGRFELGIGGGWHAEEAAAFGYEFPDTGARLDMLAEAAGLISSFFANERTTYDGEWFHASDASMLPRPVRRKMPLWIGGVGERRTLRITAEHAAGWNAAYVSPAEYARLNAVLDRHCDEIGRDPATIERSVNLMFLLATDDAAAARARHGLIDQWGDRYERVAEGALIGTPESVVERVLEYRDAGADLLNIVLRMPVDPEALDGYLAHTVPTVKAES